MEISGNSGFYAGLNAIQAGQNRVDQGSSQIASSAVERSSDSRASADQVNRLNGVDRSQESDLASSMVDMSMGKIQVELGVKVAKASDEALGTLIDTYA